MSYCLEPPNQCDGFPRRANCPSDHDFFTLNLVPYSVPSAPPGHRIGPATALSAGVMAEATPHRGPHGDPDPTRDTVLVSPDL